MQSVEREFPDGTRIVVLDHEDGSKEVRLEQDGANLSSTSIFPYLMRIGEAVVRMDGIGGVATGEEYRFRGYSRRVLESAVDVMKAGDAALTTLYGIPDFYPKFGYATCGPEYTVVLAAEEGEEIPTSLPDGWTFRPFAVDDLPVVMDLYEMSTRHATGAIVRHAGGEEQSGLRPSNSAAIRFSHRPWDQLPALDAGMEHDACRVLLNPIGELVAYAWIGRSGWWVQSRERHAPHSFQLGEVIAKDPVAADALITAVWLWAIEVSGNADQVELIVPPEGPVAHAAAYQGGMFVARHSRAGEFMARVLNLDRLFQQLQPELSARIRSACAGFEGTVLFRTDEGEVALAITRSGVSVRADASGDRIEIDLPQHTLARLALGAFDARDVMARLPGARSEQAIGVLDILFPRGHPHIHAMDRF